MNDLTEQEIVAILDELQGIRFGDYINGKEYTDTYCNDKQHHKHVMEAIQKLRSKLHVAIVDKSVDTLYKENKVQFEEKNEIKKFKDTKTT